MDIRGHREDNKRIEYIFKDGDLKVNQPLNTKNKKLIWNI